MSSQGPPPGHDLPPHMHLNVAGPSVSAGPDTTAGGTAAFISARSSNSVDAAGDSASNGEHTPDPSASTGLRVKVQLDAQGRHYLLHPDSGLRFDISDDESVPLDTPYYQAVAPYQQPNSSRRNMVGAEAQTRSSPSTVSELLSSHESPRRAASPSATIMTGERALDTLLTGLHVVLTAEQQAQYSSIRGMLSMGRQALLSTTAFVAGQRTGLDESLAAIEQVREETAEKLLDLHERVTAQESQVETCLEDNLRILRSFESTEAQLEKLTRSMAEHAGQSPKPTLPILTRSGSRVSTLLDGFQAELDNALPPRGSSEPGDAFYRRGTQSVLQKERTAASFAPPLDPTAPIQGRSTSHVRMARFEDVGSISSAPRRQYQNYLSAPVAGFAPTRENISAFSVDKQAKWPAVKFFNFTRYGLYYPSMNYNKYQGGPKSTKDQEETVQAFLRLDGSRRKPD
ncbi:hypothetical protein C8R44DRAFT_747029 [Mycena epipterygia]|nr:hypothetical protein C8R44DRAFT_747029 [Mycena epipterygia]